MPPCTKENQEEGKQRGLWARGGDVVCVTTGLFTGAVDGVVPAQRISLQHLPHECVQVMQRDEVHDEHEQVEVTLPIMQMPHMSTLVV